MNRVLRLYVRVLSWFPDWFVWRVNWYMNRLRPAPCPSCRAVGTMNVHRPSPDGKGGMRPWRMLCKYCGLYVDNEHQELKRLCYPSRNAKVWVFRGEDHGDIETLTPLELMERDMPYCWPWRR